jgi:hypothetical protein
MSITTDLRSYADKAADRAQASLNDVTGQANELYGKTRENVAGLAGKAQGTVKELRLQAEKAVNLDAIKTAVEPYLTQVKGYTHQVTDRAESLFATVKSDARVAKLVDAARPVVDAARPVVDTVQAKVVKPVTARATRASKPATKSAAAPKPAPKAPAAAKPASRPATTKPATKPAARKAPAKPVAKS